MKRMMIGLLSATLASNAFAYYMPGQGRWLSRDPIQEPGFTVATTGKQPSAETASDEELSTGRRTNPTPSEANLYVFLLNAPQSRIDALGLISFNGCDEAQKAQLTAAWNAGCAKLNDPGFACCLNRSGLLKLLKRRCSWGNVKFYCRTNGTFWCNSSTCAHAWRSVLPGINAGRIVVCYPLFNNCQRDYGKVKPSCLLMHELGHVVNASPFEGHGSSAYRTEKCCNDH